MAVNIRIATESDCEILVDLVGEFHAVEGLPQDKGELRRVLQDFLRNQSLGRAWLICSGAKAVGYVVLTFGFSLEFSGRDAIIDEIYIQAGHRKRGWGRKAMRIVEECARDFGVHAIHLEVSHHNRIAHRLYEGIGFKKRPHNWMTKWIAE